LKYPVSCKEGELGRFFYNLFTFHIPLIEGERKPKILDPTCGKKYLWVEFNKKRFGTEEKLIDDYEIVFSDLRDLGQEIVSDFRNLNFREDLDAIVFDPPYFFGIDVSDDPRAEDYGGYHQTKQDLYKTISEASILFPNWLKRGGKLFLKCSDQFVVSEKRFYPLHVDWINLFSERFDLIDIFIYVYRRVSPTAYQVKDRPCSICNYTYILVFEVKK